MSRVQIMASLRITSPLSKTITRDQLRSIKTRHPCVGYVCKPVLLFEAVFHAKRALHTAKLTSKSSLPLSVLLKK